MLMGHSLVGPGGRIWAKGGKVRVMRLLHYEPALLPQPTQLRHRPHCWLPILTSRFVSTWWISFQNNRASPRLTPLGTQYQMLLVFACKNHPTTSNVQTFKSSLSVFFWSNWLIWLLCSIKSFASEAPLVFSIVYQKDDKLKTIFMRQSSHEI